VFCVHGGISPDLTFVAQLSHFTKPDSIPPSGIIADLLWSDPRADIPEFETGARGSGYNFGYVALKNFLDKNRLRFVIRSHQYCNTFEWAFGECPKYEHTCLTIFSTTNYCGLQNHGSVASVDAMGNDPQMILLQPLTQRDKEKSLVKFPDWLMARWGLMNSPFECEESPASEPNALPLL
jgi:diadenosine tetraphosphatase ApaH/serine/threonine PP2A family protein phosphatase